MEEQHLNPPPTEEHADPSMEATPGETAAPGRARQGPSRVLIALLIGALIAVGAAIVIILNFGDRPALPTDRPEEWDAVDAAEASPLDVGNGDYEATVVIGAQDKTCWTGFVVSEPIDGCGRAVYEVTGAPRALGLNVRHDSATRAFLGLAAWAGDEQLDKLETKKKFGVVALTVYPPPE